MRFRTLVCATAILAAMSGMASGQTVTRYLDRSLYPSRISSVDFQNGSVMSASTPACWGSWCVRIGPSTTADYNSHGLLIVDQLPCTNSVVGEKTCFMILDKDSCSLWIQGEAQDSHGIKCPKSLDISR